MPQAALSNEPVVEHLHRVLVIDDNVNCAQVMMWTMEALGHTAVIAHDGQTAIALAKTFHPDVVLLDIGIPEMNGYEICQAMRLEPSLQDTLFVAQTGWGQKEHKEHAKEAGFHYHLVKPVDIAALKKIFLLWEKRNALSEAVNAAPAMPIKLTVGSVQ